MELFEREDSWAVLDRCLHQAESGNGQVVVITGEAGIGKTSLLREFVRSYTGRVLWGACEALFTPRALGPLFDMARQTDGRLAPAGDRASLFGAFLDELDSRDAPVLAVFEDLHWADEATLDLVKYVGRRIPALRALLVLSYRDDEVGPDHPLRFVLGDLPGRHRLRLLPLSEATVARLADRPAGDLYAVTGGNPFYVTEVLAHPVQSLPETVRAAVLARAARLAPPVRDVLARASVVPARMERWLLEEILGSPVEVLEACARSGTLLVTAEAITFRHELARQAIEDSLSTLRRQELHADVLKALERRAPEAFSRLVYHAERAGDRDALRRYAPRAAREAAALSAHREAAAHFRTALPLWSGREDEAALLEGLAYACYLTGQIQEAVEARRALLEIHRRRGQTRAEGDTLRWLSRLMWFLGRKEDAEGFAADAISVLEPLGDSSELAMAYSNRSQLHMLADEAEGAVWLGMRAIRLAETLGDAATRAHALNNVGAAQALAGIEGGSQLLEESLQLSLAHDLQEHAARAYTNLVSNAVRNRDYDTALDQVEAGLAYCADRDLDAWQRYMTTWRARAHFEQGAWDEAARDAERVLGGYRVPSITRIPALAILGHVRVRRGDSGAGVVLDEARALALVTGELQRLSPVAAARAEMAWWAGHPERIDEETGACYALALARRSARDLGELGFWRRKAGLSEDGRDVLPEGDPFGDLSSGHWRRATESWNRLGCPYEEALALAEGDEPARKAALDRFDRLGATPAAQALERQLRAQHVRGLTRGPRPATRDNPAGLTPRQMDVLRLLGQGLSNAEIAARLYISPKTTDHHVSAILERLQLRSRVEAATYALERGILSPK